MGIKKDEGSYEELLDNDLDSFMDRVQKTCRYKLKDRDIAGMEKDDVIQEVLVKVYLSLEQYDAEKARLSTYINKIMDNMIADCLKKGGAKKNLMVVNALHIRETDDDDTEKGFSALQITEDGGVEYLELMTDIMENLHLDDQEKTIFRLRAAGYEFNEIATTMGLKKSQVYSSWVKIKKKVETLG